MPDDALAAFQRMRDDVVAECASVVSRLDALRAQGKVKTATYQQLFARKMTLTAMLDLYRKHGLL